MGRVVGLNVRWGSGNILAAGAGFATLCIAYLLAQDGETMPQLAAVLDTQFWLATHVVCITLGYAATFAAGMCGAIYVLGGLATPVADKGVRKAGGMIVYGSVRFAMRCSFWGTVLGGLGADDAWGRVWGGAAKGGAGEVRSPASQSPVPDCCRRWSGGRPRESC